MGYNSSEARAGVNKKMKIFLDTADVAEIREFAASGPSLTEG